MIGNLFVVLLLKIKEYFWEDYNPIYEGNRSSQIVKQFKRNLEQHYRDLVSGKAEKVFRVSKVADLEKLFAAAKEAFGKIDIVVANAGIEMVEVPVTNFTEEQFDRVFSINTKGTYFTLQQAAKHVANNGRIIYIASSTTSFTVPGMAVYGGSKTTPKYLVDILSKEIGHKGITVNSIIPFAVDHAGIFTDPAAYPELRKQLLDSCPMGRLAEVADVANLAEFFASDLSSFVSDQHLLVNGGATN